MTTHHFLTSFLIGAATSVVLTPAVLWLVMRSVKKQLQADARRWLISKQMEPTYRVPSVPAFDPAMEYHNYDVVRMPDGVKCQFLNGSFHRIS